MKSDNHWRDGQLNLGTDNLKRSHFTRVTGLIQRDQDIAAYLVLDDGTFSGDGDCRPGHQDADRQLYRRLKAFPMHTDVFPHISARFQVLNIGRAINSYTYKELMEKGRRSLPIKTI
jgi:hypothetical protein